MEIYKLGEIGEIFTGNTPSKKNEEYYNSKDIPFIKPNDLSLEQISLIDTTVEYISSRGMNVARIVPKGSILVTCIGIIGKVGILQTEKAAFNQQINAIVPNENIVNRKFLAYSLTYKRRELEHMTNAAVVPIINKRQFSNLEIKLPDINKQLKIVEVLDKAQSLIKKRKQQIVELSTLAKSVFIELFGDPVKNDKEWSVSKLSQVGQLKRGMSKHRPRNAPELLNGPYPLVQTGDIGKDSLYIDKYYQTYSELGLKQSKLWPKGTLCITIAANIAQTGILSFDACFPDSVVGFVPGKSVINTYVHYWFAFFQKIIEANAPESAQKNINLKILSDLDIMVPPLDLQNKFDAIVAKIESEREQMKRSLAELESNFNGLMQAAFNEDLF